MQWRQPVRGNVLCETAALCCFPYLSDKQSGGRPMFPIEQAILIAFSCANALRIVAYVPQIIRVLRDRQGATAVACSTWLLFLVSNATTVLYAIVVLRDQYMAIIFSANSICCFFIVLLTIRQRHKARRMSMN